jgi:hypothetical protein
MAKIIETVFLVRCSQMIKDSETADIPTDWNSLSLTIEQVVQELVAANVIVEVEINK